MDQNDRAAAAVVLVVDLNGGAVLGADGDRSHCLSPFLRFSLDAGSSMRMVRPGGRTATTGTGANSVTPGRSVAAGEPRGHLLDDPQIAVGIVERAERPVAGALRVDAGLACLDRERRTVPDITYVDAELEESVMSRLDVRDDQGALRPAWRGRVQTQAERNGGRRARRRELNAAQSIHRYDVVVESPTQLPLHPLGP